MDNDFKEYALTTLDNPYSPFEEPDEWMAFDIAHGYGTCEILDRFAVTGNNLTDYENQVAINSAIDRILEIDPYSRYIKVTKESARLLKKKALSV